MNPPGLTLTLVCPHCGKDSRVTIGPSPAPEEIRIPTSPKKVRYCGCGHPASWHGDAERGRCTHGLGTASGGCDCEKFHSRRRGAAPSTAKHTNGIAKVFTRPTELGPCALAILHVLAQRAPQPTSRAQVALLSGYSPISGSFSSALGDLRARELIAGPTDALAATDAGRGRLGTVPPLPTGRDLIAYWAERLGPCAGAILQVLATAWPKDVERDDLALATGYSAQSGSFSSALGRLRTLDLVVGLRASDALMQAAAEGT